MNFNIGMIVVTEYVNMLTLSVGADKDQMLRMMGQYRIQTKC